MSHHLPQSEIQRLDQHATSLAELVARAVHPDGGFVWLGPDNTVSADRPVETWITCRMTHVAALEVMRRGAGAEHLRPLLDVGHDALTGRLRDARYRGWLPAVGGPDRPPTDKVAYAHAFVILAAASLTAAEHPGGRALLDEALDVFDTYFWDEDEGMAREQYDRAWTQCEDYRGVNANMHTVEAMLAAGEVLTDPRYLERARRIVERVVHGIARTHDWRLPEHFDAAWQVLPNYHRDRPADPFRPYGVTIGHVLEWSRLALNTRNSLGAAAYQPRWSFLLEDAAAMFEAALTRGWAVDGAEGIVYTAGFDDVPIVRERLHWVVCEGIAAAWALHDATGDPALLGWYHKLWAYAQAYLLDAGHGGWHHELSPDNVVSGAIWWGKPDLYHAYQCALAPLLPGMVSFAGAVAR